MLMTGNNNNSQHTQKSKAGEALDWQHWQPISW